MSPQSGLAPLALARKVLETEAHAVLALADRLDANFDRALDLLQGCSGRVITTGMGKSGIIARKLAATLSSTGTSAVFLHAAEAVHGDLGVVQTDDVVVALSYSGETEELLRLLQAIRRLGARLIAITGHPASTLGQAADATLNVHVAEEACPMNLAPTASTTATLAMGDALAMALSQRKGFRAEQFATLHPVGLGKRFMRVDALMHTADALPRVTLDTPMRDLIHEMSSKRLGMACVIDAEARLLGIVTDGDVRRHMEELGAALFDRRAGDVMTPRPVTVGRQIMAVEALRIMEQRKITAVVVVGIGDRLEGVVHLHDLWRTQMF
jgi:arabinose-5-phosphate isomerase